MNNPLFNYINFLLYVKKKKLYIDILSFLLNYNIFLLI